MSERTAVITGATSGIGQVAAEKLAASGYRIVQIARNRERGAAALKRLREIAPSLDHSIYAADLSLIADTKRVAAEISANESRVDVLINNAGAMFGSRQVTGEGLERTFALNHMSYFVLTLSLLDRVKAAAPSRIVNTASHAHTVGKIDFGDLQAEKLYRAGFWETVRWGGAGFLVYANSKLCNVLFTQELARRLQGTGVTANCLHPGFVATRFGDNAGPRVSLSIRVAKRFALTPEQGAETLIYLASSPDVVSISGKYFQKKEQAAVNPLAEDNALAKRLWEESARLAGLPVEEAAR